MNTKQTIKKEVTVLCPHCRSIWRYYRTKTQDYVCRRCGISFKISKTKRRFITTTTKPKPLNQNKRITK